MFGGAARGKGGWPVDVEEVFEGVRVAEVFEGGTVLLEGDEEGW